MTIEHTFQYIASITDLRKAPKWLISESNIIFAFNNLDISVGYSENIH